MEELNITIINIKRIRQKMKEIFFPINRGRGTLKKEPFVNPGILNNACIIFTALIIFYNHI